MKINIELDTAKPEAAVIRYDGDLQGGITKLALESDGSGVRDFRVSRRNGRGPYVEHLDQHQMVVAAGQGIAPDA